MTAARFYSSTAGSMELQADITDSSTTIQVDSTVGLPGTTPFTLVIDPGSTEEIVDCTGVAGTSLTVTRGVDGSPAQAHTAGAIVRHMATARDFREAQEHIGNTVAHGVAGALVGTTDSQTLTNKNLTSATNTFPSSLATDAELAAHTGATAAHGATGAVVGTTNNQALTNKDLSSVTNTFPSTLATDSELSAHTSATTGVHGVSGNVVGENNTQALTNKNLTASSNVFPSTLATTNTAQTLSGKSISGATNTLTSIPQSAVVSLGTWTDYTASIRTDTGTSAAAGTSVSVARYMKIGNTVWAYGEATASSAVSNVSAMLPTAAGTPRQRFLNCGTMIVANPGGTANSGQLSVARMTTGLDRVLTVTDTNAFCDAPAGSNIQWSVCYEVN